MRRTLSLFLSLIATNAMAYDPAKAPRYPSPDMYRPNADGIVLRGNSSSGPADGFTVTLPSGATVPLSGLANPLTSPLISKFRKVAATYDDFVGQAGDGLPWTQSADVCPALNAAFTYLVSQGGGTLMLPPGVANCATTLRASNMSHIRIEGQGTGAFSLSGTELKWIGASGLPMLDLRPTTPQTPVSAVRLHGFVLNGNGIAKTGVLIRGLKDWQEDILIAETTDAGWDIDIDEAKGPLVTGQLTGQPWSAYTVGSGGTNGTYTNVPLISPNGADSGGGTADVTISGGSVSNIVIRTAGHDYVLNQVLTIAPSSIGGTTGVTVTVGNCGNAATSFLDTSQGVNLNMKVTQQGPNSVNAKGIKIGPGSVWLDTNSSTFTNILTLTQNGAGLEIGNADTIEFPFVRVGNAAVGNTGGIVDLKGGVWGPSTSARVLRFGTVSATQGLYARGGAVPSTRNIVEKYNLESGEGPPVIETGALINMKDDRGNPVGNDGFTVNLVRSTYTPTITRAGTAQTSATVDADYRRYGREIFDLRMKLNVTGGSGAVKATLPCNPYRDTVFFGFDAANTQTMVQGRVGAQDPTVYLYMMDGSVPPTNFAPTIRGALECSQF